MPSCGNSVFSDHASAAWLGAVLDRLRRGDAPFDFAVEDAALTDRARFGPKAGVPRGEGSWWGEVRSPPELVSVFRDLYEAARGCSWEEAFWCGIVGVCPWPPSELVVESLLARDIAIERIGHLMLSDRLLWRLAERVDEALLTLAKRRYEDPVYDHSAFEEVLNSFPNHEWMLQSLVGESVTSDTKAASLVEHLKGRSSPDALFRYASEDLLLRWNTRA